MVGNLLTALFSTVGYCLLMNVPVKKIIPAYGYNNRIGIFYICRSLFVRQTFQHLAAVITADGVIIQYRSDIIGKQRQIIILL